MKLRMFAFVALGLCLSAFAAEPPASAPAAPAADTGKLVGKVFDAEGNAAKQVAVHAFSVNGREIRKVPSVKTGDDGAFTFDSLPAGTYTVRAVLPGKATAFAQDVKVEAGKTADVGTLTAQVLRPQVGRPGGGRGLTPAPKPGEDDGR